ncbi:TonB-dependent receptor [Novosphingobium sp.]|uniref:TonB-dependent receptor n=1 Tax=Novosphingobium sp. TaxID=1874826 RepID=UPI003BA959E2
MRARDTSDGRRSAARETRFRAACLLVLAWGLIESSGEALAKDRPAPGTTDQDTAANIVVTARRIGEKAERVPVAITVVDGAAIDRLAINTPLDLNKVAGLGGAPIGALTSVNFTLRGQGTAFAGQPGVIPYFAEVPSVPLTYFDLANIQVIKGPQGTLFGQTSTGGVVLFEPRRPTSGFGGYLSAEAGNRGYYQLEGAINLPVIDDRLIARVAIQVRNRDGWIKGIHPNGTTSDLNNLDNASLRVSTIWRPTDTIENYTVFAADRIRSNGTGSPLYYIDPRFMNPAVRNLAPASVPSIAAAYEFWTGSAPPAGQTFAQLLSGAFAKQLAAGPRTMFTDYGLTNETNNRSVINQTTWDVSDSLRFKNIFGLRWQTVQGATYDQDATSLPLLDFQCRFTPGTTSAAGTCAKTGGWPERTLTDEIQLQGKAFAGKLQWLLGGFLLDGGSRTFRESSRPFIVFGSLSGDPASAAFCASVNVAAPCASMARTTIRSHAVFGHASFAVLPNLHIAGGYRETWDYTRTDTTAKASYRVPFHGRQIAVPVYGEMPAAGAGIVSTVVDLPANGSYDVSVDWQASDNVLFYAAHRSGYKTGGINAVADPGSSQRTFGPERARDFEAGIKSKWSLGSIKGQINAAYYHTWYANIQEGEVIPGTAQTVTTNLANARIDGVEIEGSVSPVSWFTLAGNLAYTNARYSNWSEVSNCSAQFWRPQCAGLAPSTPVTIDHAAGLLTIDGKAIAFTPDRFANTSKWQWSIRPSLQLQQWLGQDITLAANIYHRGPYVDAVAVANTSKLAGVQPLIQPTVFGYATSDPYTAPGYTITDLRIDWRRVGGSRFSLAAGVTNLADKNYRVSSASAFEIIGDVYTLTGEPRMWFTQLAFEF